VSAICIGIALKFRVRDKRRAKNDILAIFFSDLLHLVWSLQVSVVGIIFMNVVRLKLTCEECGNVGYVELTKKDLKKLLVLIKMGSNSRTSQGRLWLRVPSESS